MVHTHTHTAGAPSHTLHSIMGALLPRPFKPIAFPTHSMGHDTVKTHQQLDGLHLVSPPPCPCLAGGLCSKQSLLPQSWPAAMQSSASCVIQAAAHMQTSVCITETNCAPLHNFAPCRHWLHTSKLPAQHLQPPASHSLLDFADGQVVAELQVFQRLVACCVYGLLFQQRSALRHQRLLSLPQAHLTLQGDRDRGTYGWDACWRVVRVCCSIVRS